MEIQARSDENAVPSGEEEETNKYQSWRGQMKKRGEWTDGREWQCSCVDVCLTSLLEILLRHEQHRQ
jgi:hypothetical protein